MRDWSELPVNLITGLLARVEIFDIRSLRLVCSQWKNNVDKSLQYVKPKQFKARELVERFPGIVYLNLDESVPEIEPNSVDLLPLTELNGIQGLNLRYSPSQGFRGKALEVSQEQAHIIGQLTQLRHLDISGQDKLVASGFLFVSNLKQLESLFIENLLGELPEQCWDALAGVSSLTKLEIRGDNTRRALRLNIVSERLTLLKQLGIGNTNWQNFSQGVKELYKFPNLIHLDLSHARIQQEIDVDWIAKAVSLRTLLLNGNQLRDTQLMSLQKLRELHHLSLGGTQIVGDILLYLSHLTYLDISNCQHLDAVPVIKYLQTTATLHTFIMTNCTVQVPIEVVGPGEMPQAHMLYQQMVPNPNVQQPTLKVMDLTGTMRAPFIMWRTLMVQNLQLEKLLVGRSSDAIDAFVNVLQYQKQLKVLNLASCLTSHRCLGAVSFMPDLEELNVDFCALDAEKLCYSLTSCGSLKALEIQKGRNIDAGLSLISMRFRNLQRLNLSHCTFDFTDLGMASVVQLRKLTELRMAYCKKVTDLAFAEVGRCLTNLKILDLQGCAISDIGFQNLERLKYLEMLEISHCENLSRGIIPIVCKMNMLKSLYMESMEQIDTLDFVELRECQSLTQLVAQRMFDDGFFPPWLTAR
eukprot:TRINITY_DN3642_c2_g1_i2.p1 TRINITY_DN3642_c2_g1~~TRINITY_DN3642_c2_g1_i2.p1  ORF type:complete len:639 (-),score=47.09 TRINITY_DN3642_c2_g1_i2:1966-3882(-)